MPNWNCFAEFELKKLFAYFYSVRHYTDRQFAIKMLESKGEKALGIATGRCGFSDYY